MKRVCVLGAAGFIGGHLVSALKKRGDWVRGVDIKDPEFSETEADHFVKFDLRDKLPSKFLFERMDEVYQLAASMGGAGYCFSGENDAEIMHSNALINLNVVEACRKAAVGRVFYSSSACVYPDTDVSTGQPNISCHEDSVYPARPDSDYGWEKLFSERLYAAYARNHGLDIRIARYHNIFGPLGTWEGGREKAPAAMCRKVAEAENYTGSIEIWGDGAQTRSFCYIDDCIEGTLRLMSSNYKSPLNIGSAEMVSIDQLVQTVCAVAGKQLGIKHIPGPIGVQGRNSNNELCLDVLGWAPKIPLHVGMGPTYRWIAQQVAGAPERQQDNGA